MAKDPGLIQEVTQLHADFCHALTDTRRLLIIYCLAEGPRNVTQLTEDLGFSQPSVSRHLKVLRERGLVKGTRDGLNMEYELTDMRLIEALDLLRTVMRDQFARRASLAGVDPAALD
jgi:ArsR family transcriptional regulator